MSGFVNLNPLIVTLSTRTAMDGRTIASVAPAIGFESLDYDGPYIVLDVIWNIRTPTDVYAT